jgi:membrane protease subunit (stomatin/prohibitin family)
MSMSKTKIPDNYKLTRIIKRGSLIRILEQKMVILIQDAVICSSKYNKGVLYFEKSATVPAIYNFVKNIYANYEYEIIYEMK